MKKDDDSNNSVQCTQISSEILKYLNSKGKIKAALLHKLIARFCKKNSEFKVKKKDLFSCLMKMLSAGIVSIIIPELFSIEWGESVLNDLKFLQNNSIYLTRQYNVNEEYFGSYTKNNYFFDSRRLNLENQKEIAEWIIKLNILIKKAPNLKYMMIIYLKSEPLTIYEPFEGVYHLKFRDFKINPQIPQTSKIVIPLDKQKSDLSIIQSYRANYQCFYIKLIESIQKAIVNIQENRNIPNYEETLSDFITKFAYHCIMYVWSDWVEAKHGWESFFRFFNIPIKIIILDFENIKFYGRTFETYCRFKFCIYIEKSFQEVIRKLKNLGYTEFTEESDDYIAIGLNLETFIPCSTIEHFYFVFKYLYYYHLFLLFSHSFEYIKETLLGPKFTETDCNLYELFLPGMHRFFGIKNNKISDRLIFNYYTFNPDELELIYNRFLLEQVYMIEKKFFRYFLFRSSK